MRDLSRRFIVSTSLVRLASAAAFLFSSLPIASAADRQTIAFEGFETAGGTWPSLTLTGGGKISNNPGRYPEAVQRFYESANAFQINGVNGTFGGVEFGTVNVSGFESVQITLKVASLGGTINNGNDTDDYLKFYVTLDGVASQTPDLTIKGGANAFWGYDGAQTATATAGGTPMTFSGNGALTNRNYATVVITIPSSVTNVGFRLEGETDHTAEYWNVDAVTLSGVPLAVPEPSVAMSMIGGVGMLCGLSRMRRRWR